jgi:3',5'-cyclic AMP phosphodiesterase CpdA
MASDSPKVFISYSHDSDGHADLVLALAERLRSDGVDARIDQYVAGTPVEGWPRWMLNQLDWADFVLVVCTETYYRRFRGREKSGKGKGADWEGNLITLEMYDAKSTTTKFAPVSFDGQNEQFIPEPLLGHIIYVLNSEESYDKLYAFLVGQAGVLPREVGPLKKLARKQVNPLIFGETGVQKISFGRPHPLRNPAPGGLPSEGISNSITLLHISDIQFGRNHRFGRLGLPPPDDQFDSLFARLADDLSSLRRTYQLKPDLFLITGDLAEWGKKSEFEDALHFVEKVTLLLDLKRSHVVIIPGNHDINRKACEAYFMNCEANDEEPLPPFWPKWKHYHALFQKFYADESAITFTQEDPWTFFEVPDLKLVVAGLNSTMAESHNEGTHYGWVGEAQSRYFKERLAPFKEKGWLRIGAVHHNYQRGCSKDEENLKDADELKNILSRSLNLLLHGHTHEGKVAWVTQNVPVLSTGSAALEVSARPEEVPNQYQFIQIYADGITRWTRCFDPRQKKWIGDTRGSVDGNDWITVDKVQFEHVSGTFPDDTPPGEPSSNLQENRAEYVLDIKRQRHDDFLARVAEVCECRWPGAKVTPIRSAQPCLDYLRVVVTQAPFVRQYPIGAFENGLTRADLDRFLTLVDAKYRISDSGLTSEIVYGGSEPVAEDIVREAERRRVLLLSFVEYQGIIDFRGYIKRQTDKLEKDTIYPPALYVPQRMKFAIGRNENETSKDALVTAAEWLASPNARDRLARCFS